MLKILGRRTSGNVMLPLWAADELGIAYEQVDIGGDFGGNDQPEYLAKNPNGLVPTIDDDGFVLWESNARAETAGSDHRARIRGCFSPGAGASAAGFQGREIRRRVIAVKSGPGTVAQRHRTGAPWCISGRTCPACRRCSRR